MSSKRLALHQVLVDKLGSSHVYFQKPTSSQMEYPCIVYEIKDAPSKFADDIPYLNTIGYQVTLIDKDPDTNVFDGLKSVPWCRFDRHFVSDNLHHYVFVIHF